MRVAFLCAVDSCSLANRISPVAAATVTGVSSGSHPFLLFARHGTFELYVGEPLMLVQTMTYGDYPVAKARLGLAAKSGASASQLEAWHMSL